MKWSSLNVILGIGILLLSFQSLEANTYASDVRIFFSGNFSSGPAMISFVLNDSATSVVVNIKLGATVVRTINSGARSRGEHIVAWDGKNELGVTVSGGVYTVEIETTGPNYTSWTMFFDSGQIGIFTRGVDVNRNPAQRDFGFFYAACNAGPLGRGILRFRANGAPAGGDTLGGYIVKPTIDDWVGSAGAQRIYFPAIDWRGWVWVTDPDSGEFGSAAVRVFKPQDQSVIKVIKGVKWPFGLAAQDTGTTFKLYVAANTFVLRYRLGTGLFASAPDTVAKLGTRVIDLILDDAGFLYVNLRAGTTRDGTSGGGISTEKYNILGVLPVTRANALWSVPWTGSRPVGIAINPGTNRVSNVDDRLYISVSEGDFGIFEISGIGGTSPIVTKIFNPPLGNINNRADLTADAVGNAILFDNNQEHVYFISPPGGGTHITHALDPITVIAQPNQSPAVINSIPGQTLTVGGSAFVRNLNASPAIFADPDGDALIYAAASSATAMATANISGSTLTVAPVAAGNATITVSANDSRGGTVSTTFTLTVTNVSANQPPVLANTVLDQTLIAGGAPFVRNLNASPAVFIDPDGDPLTYTANSNVSAVATTNIAGNTLTVTPVSSGSAIITIAANDGKGGSKSAMTNFTVLPNRPPVVTHAPLSLQEAAQPISILANITDDVGIASAMLFYRRGGSVNFTTLPLSPIAGSYQGTIPAGDVTSRGVEYYLQASDQNGFTTKSAANAVVIHIGGEGETKRSAQPGGGEQSAYRLISVPLDLENKNPRAVLEDDLGPYDIFKWRCYEIRSDQTRAEFPNISDMTPGKAFWLIVKDEGKILDTGAGKSNSTLKKYALALHAKWNLVGNPFAFPIPLSNIRLKSGEESPELRSYTGNWNDPVNETVVFMQPFQGYAVFNGSTTIDSLLVDPITFSSPNALSKDVTVSSKASFFWSIRIHAQCQQARDIDNLAAVSANASDAHDEMDRAEPPVIGEYVSVYFPHSEWKTLSEDYCADVRPTTSDSGLWTFEVKTNIRDVVQLSFDGLDSVPPEFEVWLVDEVLKISHNLREKNYYSVAGTEHPKRLKLVVGKRDFIDKQLATVQAIPSNYELSQNFPNPFNPVTTIRYGLPREERVTLKVYDLLGHEVVTLINNELKNAGYHAAIWDGRNVAGNTVASGVYFIRIRAGSFVQTRKMALVE